MTAAPAPQTLGGLVEWAAASFGDEVAWVFDRDGDTWTFAQVHRATRALAHWLLERVPTTGARVAVMLPNQAEFPLTWLACATAGLVLVPIHARSQIDDTAHVLCDGEVSLVLTTPEIRPVVLEAIAGLADPPQVVVTTELPLHEDAPPGTPAAAPAAHQLVSIQYTSGTSGVPKGCMLSHRYWLQLARSLCSDHPRVVGDDTLYTAQPFSYIDPQWNVVTAMLAGARLVVADRFSASRMWADVRRHQVTVFYCLGMMPAALLAQPETPEDRQHRVRAVIASGIPPELHARLEERWGVRWYEAFGMTETGTDLHTSPADEDIVGTGCLGVPHQGRDARVVDAHGTPVPIGEVGELELCGVGLMDGYWRRPGATAAAFRGGWLRTGDLALQDSRGRFYYRGRRKDTVRRSGENVSAREVEMAVESHPAVLTAAVVPEPDALRGEEVKVFVVLAPGTGEEVLPAVRRHCLTRLAAFKVPRYWAVRDTLPLTPSERPAKAALRKDAGPSVDLIDVGP